MIDARDTTSMSANTTVKNSKHGCTNARLNPTPDGENRHMSFKTWPSHM